ncbi:MAG: C25 family cysteine peptidase [Phycisphaerales bacterium]|nr:C25 family cysteine peptidase [Phycisphaerales bacterium]
MRIHTPLSLLAAGVVTGLGLATVATAGESVNIDVIQDDASSIVLHYDFSEGTQKTVKVGEHAYTSVALPGEVNRLDAGYPSLPRVSRSIIIPNTADMEAVLIGGEYEDIQGIDIVPSKGSILRTVSPATVPYTFDKAYDENAFWPASVAELSDPYILRSNRGVTVRVNPFQYNPVTGTLRVWKNMTVAVDNVGPSRMNILPNDGKKHDGGNAFHTIYSNHFLNYNRDLRSNPIIEEGSMIVISAPQFMDNMGPFVDHKNSIGIATSLVDVSTVGSTWSQIHSYIGSMYSGTDLVYVLLVGDSAHIPASTSAGGLSDPNYTKQAGSDDYPDLVIGRFSANNDAQVDTQVERTITYETEQWTLKDEYNNAQGAASNQGPGDDGEYDHEHMAVLGDKYLEWDVVEWNMEADPSGSMSEFISRWNAGIGHIQYTGHGWQQGWSNGAAVGNSEVNQLTNTGMLPYIVTVGCVVGEYNTGDCFSEVTQWATHNGQPTGAITHYGSTINQYWNEPMRGQDAMVDLMIAEEYFTMGALCFMGSVNMVDAYGQSGIDMLDTWHIFGDPSVVISGTAQPPTGMRVSGSGLSSEGPLGGPFAPESTSFVLTNYENYPLDYSVSESVSWLTMSGDMSGEIPVGGTVEVMAHIDQGVASSLGNGNYTGSIQFTNVTNNDGSTTKPVDITVGVPVMIYEWTMDVDPGWTYSGQWGWSAPTGGGGQYGNPDPVGGADGPYCVNYNPAGDYANSLSETNMSTTAIDCSSLTDTILKFDRYLNVETDFYDHAWIKISTNGSSWSTLWTNSGEVTDSSWSQQEYDISSQADGEETVYIRFVMGTTDSSWQYSGWNIDNFQIWGVDGDSNPTCPGDIDGSGVVNVNDLLAVIQEWGTPYTVDDLLLVIANWNVSCP